MLRAINVTSTVSPTPDRRCVLMVPTREAPRAIRELTEYENENRERRKPGATKDTPLYRHSFWAVATVLSLVLFYSITGPIAQNSIWFRQGVADSDAIMSGAIYQAATALTLHSTSKHLVGNVAIGGVLFAMTHRRLGPGLGSVAVLLAGVAGNLMNAAWHGTSHRSLGASTAVMGAVGILAMSQMILNRARRPSAKAVVTWAPLVTGGALLGVFGASPGSDLHAHGFGFLAGVIIGAMAAYPLRHRVAPLPAWFNFVFGIAAAAIVAASWLFALYRH